MTELSDKELGRETAAVTSVQHLAELDSMLIRVGMSYSLSKGVIRVVTISEPSYDKRKWRVLVENLSFEGGDESVEALLRRLADLIEKAKDSPGQISPAGSLSSSSDLVQR